jgi:hypothetical protein
MATIKISYDHNSESPRDWDNLGVIYSSCHGDEGIDDEIIKLVTSEDYISLPVYKFEHGGIKLSTVSFSCRWDSGLIGYIAVKRSVVHKEFNCKRISPKLKEKVFSILESEIKVLSQYLNGETFQLTVIDSEGNDDSVGGFYGMEYKENGMIDYFPEGWSESDIEYVLD